MKINSITANMGYLKSRTSGGMKAKGNECVKERARINKNYNDQINTTIKRNPDGRASFKGGSLPLLHSIAKFTGEKPLLAEALFALSITCALRPLTIMATAKTEEDKEKCHYQAAKSIASGLLGLAATALISSPVSKATNAMNKAGGFKIPEAVSKKANEIINNSASTKKLVETSRKVLKNYSSTSKNIMDKLFQPIFLPLRAKLTIMAVPVILGALGLKKSSSKKNENKSSSINNTNYTIFQSENEKDLFKSFSGVVNHENK